MTKDELADHASQLRDEITANYKNKGTHDARELAIIVKCFDIGMAVASAIVSIAESQAHIAKGTARDWKPGDDVAK